MHTTAPGIKAFPCIMWSILNGTIINAATVVVGTSAGLLLSGRIPERFQRIVLDALGLVTITLGVDAAVMVTGDTVERYRPAGDAGKTYGAMLAMVTVGSLLVGSLMGTWLRLHDRSEGLGEAVHRRFGGGGGRKFSEGFLTASVIFCVGPLTLLGCFENGANGDPSLLMIKSLLDGFCSAALAAGLGWGVMLSVATVLLFQGSLAILAHVSAGAIPDLSQQLRGVDHLASIGHGQPQGAGPQRKPFSSTAETTAPAASHFQLSWKKLIT